MSNKISEDCSSHLHEYCTPCECECHEKNSIELDKETATELLAMLSHQFVNHKYTRVHELIARLNKFIETK